MSTIHEFPNGNQSYDEASLWIARVDKGLSAKDEEELKAWLFEADANHATFMKMAKRFRGFVSGAFRIDKNRSACLNRAFHFF